MSEEIKNYNSSEFLETWKKKVAGHFFSGCPFCGSYDYSTPQEMATIFVANKFQGIKIGPSVPCGMVICKQCGHVDFFALGILKMLPSKEKKEQGDDNGK